MSLTDAQRTAVLALIGQGSHTNEEIAQEAGVSPGSVAAVRANLTMGRYNLGPSIQTAEDLENAGETIFSIERDMQGALRANIQQLEEGLVITDDGKERITAQGWRLDITARDISGNTVVIELKAGTAASGALAQVMAYVGAVSEEEGKMARAYLVADDFDPKLKIAAMAIPNLQLRRYKIKFMFSAVSS